MSDTAIFIGGNCITTSPASCVYTENAGGRCDTLLASFRDESGELAGIGIEKGQEMEAFCGAIETGRMYVSEVRWGNDIVSVKAVSMPAPCVSLNESWEKASFEEILRDMAEETGLALSLRHPLGVHYERVDRLGMTPIEFLSDRLSLECYSFRVHDGRLDVYDERIAETAEYEQQLWAGDFLKGLSCLTSDAGILAAVENFFQAPDGRLMRTRVESGLPGRTLRKSMAVSSIDESERFSRGLMRLSNKNEYMAEGTISGDGFRAGTTVWLVDAPHGHDGLNFIQRVQSDFPKGTQALSMRKPISGGY